VAASRTEVVVRQVADRVQHDVREHHEHERHEVEPSVGRGEQPREQRGLERDDEDDAARRIQEARDGVEPGEVFGERRIEAGEGAGPFARPSA